MATSPIGTAEPSIVALSQCHKTETNIDEITLVFFTIWYRHFCCLCVMDARHSLYTVLELMIPLLTS